MNDLISRQDAIDTVAEGLKRVFVNYRDVAEKMLNKVPPAQPEQRWIPCSERMPEEDGQYLITVKYKHVDGYDDIYAEHGELYDGKWVYCFGHCGEVEDIIAWMPLPAPWEEGQDE